MATTKTECMASMAGALSYYQNPNTAENIVGIVKDALEALAGTVRPPESYELTEEELAGWYDMAVEESELFNRGAAPAVDAAKARVDALRRYRSAALAVYAEYAEWVRAAPLRRSLETDQYLVNLIENEIWESIRADLRACDAMGTYPSREGLLSKAREAMAPLVEAALDGVIARYDPRRAAAVQGFTRESVDEFSEALATGDDHDDEVMAAAEEFVRRNPGFFAHNENNPF